MTDANPLSCRLGPVAREPLKALRVSNIGAAKPPRLHKPDRGRRRDGQARASLERRHGIDSPTEAGVAFRPVEPEGSGYSVTYQFPHIIGEQHPARVRVAGSHEEHAAPPLRQTERLCIHNTVSPAVASFLHGADQIAHGSASMEVQHERHVLKDQPLGPDPSPAKECKQVLHEARLTTVNPVHAARLAQVRTREAGCDDVGGREYGEVPYIVCNRDMPKARPQDRSRHLVLFHESDGAVAGPGQAVFDSTDSCEEADCREGRSHLGTRFVVSIRHPSMLSRDASCRNAAVRHQIRTQPRRCSSAGELILLDRFRPWRSCQRIDSQTWCC